MKKIVGNSLWFMKAWKINGMKIMESPETMDIKVMVEGAIPNSEVTK
jgi:hypothetical protein